MHATHLTINLYTCIFSLHLMMHSSTKNINGTQPRCVSWNFGMQGMHSVLVITETKLLFFSQYIKPASYLYNVCYIMHVIKRIALFYIYVHRVDNRGL